MAHGADSAVVSASTVGDGGDNEVFEQFIMCENLHLYPNMREIYRVTSTKKYISWELTAQESKTSVKARPIKARRESLKGRRSSSRLSLGDDSILSQMRDSIVENGGLFINMDDVVGCDCMKGRTENDPKAYVTIYAYPHKKKLGSKRTVRKRETLTLVFSKYDTYDENMKGAIKWRNVLQGLAKRIDIPQGQDLENLHLRVPKKMMVLVNPYGGQGKALKMYKQRVLPILAEASIPHEIIVTEYAGHARDMMKTLDTDAWYGLISVSGDGLLHEIVNGLMSRADWKHAMKMPIGILPGGSGNALCCALSHYSGEPYLDNHIMHATYAITKHTVVPMDLVAIDTFKGERLYSFLMVAWGIMADADIESEKYRSLGNARFTVGAVVRILGLRKYKGRVSFLSAEKYHPKPKFLVRSKSANEYSDHKVAPPTRSVSMVATSNEALSGRSESVCEEVDVTEGLEKVQLEAQDDENEQDGEKILNGHSDSDKIETPLLAPLDQPVPDNWITIEDEFVNVAAIYQSHLAKDMLPVPDCKLDDGVINLIMIRGSIGRMKLIQEFTAMQEGKPPSCSDVEVVKVKAFRIEPITTEGMMTCDGELISYGPIQGQVLPAVANVMSLMK